MKTATFAALLLANVGIAANIGAQHTHDGLYNADSTHMIGAADATMGGPMSAAARKHMLLSPARQGTREDTIRAREVAQRLRVALSKYADTVAAVADGYKMFAPKLKQQRVYHFTNYRNAFREAFRFDPDKPTSILYTRNPDGTFKLIGAMYTAPKRMDAAKLDERVPLSIARWHKHVNWCIPRARARERWLERKDGQPVFGPESPIATREECQAVGGRFLASPMGWMIHANVFLGSDLSTVFGHEH